jgi:hypothetical protein
LAVYALDDAIPDIHPEAYIHPEACIIHPEAYVHPDATVLRYRAELRRIH